MFRRLFQSTEDKNASRDELPEDIIQSMNELRAAHAEALNQAERSERARIKLESALDRWGALTGPELLPRK